MLDRIRMATLPPCLSKRFFLMISKLLSVKLFSSVNQVSERSIMSKFAARFCNSYHFVFKLLQFHCKIFMDIKKEN